MEIKFLGHSGFYVESPHWVLIMDPWLSPAGAYEMAWFQYPRNHHLGSWLIDRINSIQKPIYLYVSHEHKDHFDPAYIQKLPVKKIHAVLPNFRRKKLRENFKALGFQTITEVADGESFTVQEGHFRFFIEDVELDRDSAILVKSGQQTFLNFNDCKVYDKIPEILKDQGQIDVFTAQFSGANWHPTCYLYPPEHYKKISATKKNNKFKTLARAIGLLNPKVYIPSAGPACFLDPSLFHLNFEEENIFPRNEVFLSYLKRELKDSLPRCIDMHPGDRFDISSASVSQDQSVPRVSEENIREYLERYRDNYAEEFRQRKARPLDLPATLENLKKKLQEKLDSFPLRKELHLILYFGLMELPLDIIAVDFQKGKAQIVPSTEPVAPFYRLRAEAQQIHSVLSGEMNWEDFTLTFRVHVDRQPDDFKTLISAYISVESKDLPAFCQKWLSLQDNKDSIRVKVGGKEYEISHYCPHQGADLSTGWSEEDRYWVCPKHGWKFDLENGGTCTMNGSTVKAKCLKS